MFSDRHLVAACGDCIALCCTLYSFDASEDFAFSKPAGVRCSHVLPSCRCAIHDELAIRGQRGCVAYTCHGAGPRATKLFASTVLTKRQRHDVFEVVSALHEMLWIVSGAAKLCAELRDELEYSATRLDALAAGTAREILAIDVAAERATVHALLVRVRARR